MNISLHVFSCLLFRNVTIWLQMVKANFCAQLPLCFMELRIYACERKNGKCLKTQLTSKYRADSKETTRLTCSFDVYTRSPLRKDNPDQIFWRFLLCLHITIRTFYRSSVWCRKIKKNTEFYFLTPDCIL
jgi:hypothetical protein